MGSLSISNHLLFNPSGKDGGSRKEPLTYISWNLLHEMLWRQECKVTIGHDTASCVDPEAKSNSPARIELRFPLIE